MNFDFPAILVLLVAVTGLIWALDSLVTLIRRRQRISAGIDVGDMPSNGVLSYLAEFAQSFFPVFLIVLVLRSFLVEPFRIPSNSMMPTLLTGDFILVNKFTYGIRLPVLDQKIIEISSPKRGDVVVFRAPPDPATPYIKRIIGLPGDKITYKNKTVFINQEQIPQERLGVYTGLRSGANMTGVEHIQELLPGAPHEILIDPDTPRRGEGQFVVPQGHYLVLGDNRDNSHDSRFWGFVPDKYLIGKAFGIWLHLDWNYKLDGLDFGRIGNSID